MPADLLPELEDRGLVAQISDPQLGALAAKEGLTLYCGFDPSAASLTTGHLLQMLTLARFQRAGHTAIAVAGGGTGLIGDPSGRDSERPLLSSEEIGANVASIRGQLERFIDLGGASGDLIDNLEWLKGLSYIEVLRDVGKHFSVNSMIAKEFVRARLEEREQGISYTEFSYVILQAYDYLHLFDTRGCRLQIGGNDQWGNITAGVELIRKARHETVYALTTPLILIGGKKMSKSEGSAIWLDPQMTSPYAFYQYWMNATDDQVGQLLRYYTFLSLDEVADLESATAANPAERAAHRTLAWEVTSLVHGEDAAKSARKASEVLFTAEVAELDEETFLAAMSDAPRTEMSKGDFEASSVSRLLEVTGLSKSLSEARRDVSSGGAYVNNERSVVDEAIAPSKLLHGRFLVMRKGKKNYHLIEVK